MHDLKITNFVTAIGTISSITFLGIVIAFPIWITIFLYQNKQNLENVVIKRKFVVLYSFISNHNIFSLLYYVVFLLRRLFYAVVFVFLNKCPVT